MQFVKVTKIKHPTQYNTNVTKLFHLLSFKKHDPVVVGSNSMKFYHAGDYDLFSVVKTDVSLEKLKRMLFEEFQRMVTRVESDKDIFFVELMAGVDNEGKPLKWSPKEVKKGFMTREGHRYNFTGVLNEESIIKVEIIGYVPSVGFVPVSNAFEFQTSDGKGINHKQITIDTVDSLKKDIKKFHEKGNLMKVLKRLFIVSITEKNKALSEKLTNIFQGDIGKIYKCKSSLEAVRDVVENYHDATTMQRAHDEIQKVKEAIGVQTVYQFKEPFFRKLDKVSRTKNYKTMMRYIDAVCDDILVVVNKLLKKKIKSDRIRFDKYLN
jgi:hypothetical protein